VPRLAVYLLGPPRIERDGVAIRLDRRKAIALLAYLAVTGQRHRRDSLVNLLWSDYDTTSGRAALRRTLHALSAALGGDWLETDREEIGLKPGTDLWVDVDQYRRRLSDCATHGHPAAQVCPACVAPLAEAAELVRGEFLSGFGLKDSLNFDDWQLFQAEALRRELVDALDGLVRWHSAQREFEPALGYARHRLALDPLDEPAHRQLMCLYVWSGRRSAALRQYEECVAVLTDQLGVPPQDATRQLHDEIQAGRPPPLPTALDSAAEPPSFHRGDPEVERPVFVARERELAQLDRHLQGVLAGQGRVVFVTGEAGSGKTALIQEFARRAQEAHAGALEGSTEALVVASGNCNAYTGIGDPYLPFREILALMTGDVEARWAAGAMTREHVRRLWQTLPLTAQALLEAGPDLIDTFVSRAALVERAVISTQWPGRADWLTRLDERAERKPTGPGMPGLQQNDLFEQYTRVLQVLARQVSLALVVDDLQWADLGSISLLFHLGRHLAGNRILIIGAYRPEEVTVGRDGERHPLDAVVNEFQRDFGDITVSVGQAESRDFVEALLDTEPNRLGGTFREMLYRQTRGHPLFTIELLRGLQERGDLVQNPEGQWVEGMALDWGMLPARVEAAIRERIGRLGEPLQAALQVASVEGEVFTAEVVTRVLGSDERTMVQRLSSELDRRHRLVRAEAIERLESRRLSRYRFRNYLFQKYLYDSLDKVERTYLHEDVGNVLEALYGDQPSDVAVQLAWHFQEAGIAKKAIHYLHQAGDKAVRLSAYQEGRAHLTKGLALLMTLPDSPERAQQELALQLSLGIAWMGDIPGSQWKNALTRARELCQQMGKMSELSRVMGELSISHYVQAEYQKAHLLGEEALSLAEQAGDPLVVAVSHWHVGYSLFGLGDYTAGRAHLDQMISFYKPQQHHRPLVFLRGSDTGVSALAYDACCLWCLGYPEQALERSREALALARELDHAFTLADVLCFGGCLFNKMRRDTQALKDTAQELIRLSKELSFSSFGGTGICYWGEALTELGRVQEGMALIHEGLAIRQSIGVRCHLAGILGALAEAQAMTGQPDQGLTTLAEALAFVEETDERHWEAELHRLRAELLLTLGNEAGTEISLRQAIEIARRQSARSWELRASTSLARLWQTQGRIGEARHMLAQIYGWFTEGFDTPDLKEAKALLEELS